MWRKLNSLIILGTTYGVRSDGINEKNLFIISFLYEREEKAQNKFRYKNLKKKLLDDAIDLKICEKLSIYFSDMKNIIAIFPNQWIRILYLCTDLQERTKNVNMNEYLNNLFTDNIENFYIFVDKFNNIF